ncbi:MAG TPA: hypothetical protein VMK05_06670, partial [Burkholderiales bacterium]|nr:hypothetical protein [Burkholderiales bacterium]
PHVLLIAAVTAFALLLREEDFLLYGLLLLFALALLRQLRAAGAPLRGRVAAAAMVAAILPFACGYGANLVAREYVQAHYGVALIHDFGDGEFPALIAAMRSLESRKDNRFVMITQEALGRLRTEVPRLAPVIERLPRPGAGTYSCQRYGVCSEWANGWMLFWIKDAAFEAGLTPDARSAQEFFRLARIDIERACAEGRLQCRDKGRGVLPPFELRWTRAYLQEWSALVGMWLAPRPAILQEIKTRFEVDSVLARMFQIVTMTHQADTRLQAPAATPLAQPVIDTGLREWRAAIGAAYPVLGGAVELAAAAALVYLYRRRRGPLHGPFVATAVLFGLYTGLRLCALAYAAVYMGYYDPRMIFSSYVATLLICPALIAEAYTLRLAARRAQ